VAEAVNRSTGNDDLDAYKNLSQRSPFLSLSMLLFLLSLGGIPFVIGFWAKLYIFLAAARSGHFTLVIIGSILTVVALFYYLNIARRMYIDKGNDEIKPIHLPFSLKLSIGICAVLVVFLGFYPKIIVSVSERAISSFKMPL
jgi:NADH-quinone oxidoreductase subunit N